MCLQLMQNYFFLFKVHQTTTLWDHFEQGHCPFPQAVILGDSAYPCRDWLIPPFVGHPDGERGQFNTAHRKTRNVIERAFGILKNRFTVLKTPLRLRSMEECGRLVICCVILHNLCLKFGDASDDLMDDFDEIAAAEQDENNPEAAQQNDRKLSLVHQFMQHR